MKNPPEYRKHRVAVLSVFILATVSFCLCIIVGGFRGAIARQGVMPELAPRESVDAAALRQCMAGLDELYVELNERLDVALGSRPARRSSVEWEDWSPAWRARLLRVGARCRLSEADVPKAEPLRIAWERLSQLHRHYSTLAVQFSKEIGPSSDRLHQTMERARESVGGGTPQQP